ncbi:hypothetical protein ACFFQW_33860 [Umezawaea endophytica]|uniref:Uncharacterized protein n=1 Tax=Umezawaea endophytica TaxID=1654476 RepID=A0A9X3AF02_9PSEU|nr:hypothetical protein [Umezawaea endophytica]MCS7476550.1 hypothetical protein [Umezawaea endophytica]
MGRGRAVAAAVTVAFAVSGVLVARADETGVAHWGECEFGLCGTVVNDLELPVDVALSWCEWAPCETEPIRTIPARSSSDAGGKIDIDAFHVPEGLRYQVVLSHTFSRETVWLGPGWHKMSTDTVAHITAHQVGPVVGRAL